MTERRKTENLALTKSSEHLNKQILDYCYKFGQNRDLEKYLRLHRKNNKSSSEGSLSGISCKHLKEIESEKNSLKRQSKSLDGVDQSASECILENSQGTKDYNILSENECSMSAGEAKYNELDLSTSIDIENNKIELSANPSGDISYNIYKEKSNELHEIREFTNFNNIIAGSKQDNEVLETTEGVKKTSKVLEWDSLGDVGYSRSLANPNLNRSMSTIERSVLKGFFADRGIEISFPKSNKNEKPTERWRATLENVKKKYSSSPSLLKHNTKDILKDESKNQIAKPKPKSAKVLDDSYKKTESENKNFTIQSAAKACSSVPQIQRRENYCQTSIIPKEDQFIQCNFSTASNSVTEDQSIISQPSFIYVAKEFESTGNESGPTSSSKDLNTVKTFLKSELHESVSKLIGTKNHKIRSVNCRDIDLGISLLCALIDSKNFDDRQKKKLAIKIVNKITRQHISSTDESVKESSTNPDENEVNSLISSFSEKNHINNFNVPKKETFEKNNELKSVPKNFFQDRDNYKKNEMRLNTDSNGATDDVLTEKESKAVEQVKINKQTKINENQKNTHLLERMKEWLEPLTNSELAYERKIRNASKENVNSNSNDIYVKNLECEKNNLVDNTKEIQKKIHLGWIENEIKRLENLKNLLITENNVVSKNLSSTKNIKNSTRPAYIPMLYRTNSEREYDNVAETNQKSQSQAISRKDSRNHILYDDIHSRSKQKEDQLKLFPLPNVTNSSSESQTTRSKLKTPLKENIDNDSSDSIMTFVKNRKREVLENYKMAHESKRSYDHPMVSDHYSEPGYKNIPIANKDFLFSSKYRNASASTSNDFISSESISLPVNVDISSASTTHQYDASTINGIGIQTSDSILQTSPIFGVTSTDKLIKIDSHNNGIRKTTRFYGPRGKSQQIQVKPQTISYTIKVNDNKNNDNLSLQEHLKQKCPNFYFKAYKRQEILKEMQKLRKDREEQIRRIVENTSINSLNKKLNNVPPPPTKCIRVFTTKEMKAMTRKKQKCLSEVVDKVEKQKKEKQRKGTKLLTEVFNKRLQKQVHKGKLSLEHSLTVI